LPAQIFLAKEEFSDVNLPSINRVADYDS